jgi:hypothetical protein
MDNLFLEEFAEKVDPNTIKEIQIFDKSNIFSNDNDILESIDNYDINTNTIIHKQEKISEDSNEHKIYDISKLYTKEITKERILISYEDMNDSSYVNFNGSYECDFNLNKTYNNVIGFKLNKAIYENIDRNLRGPHTNIYLDVIVNNIPREACINNLKGYNIIERLPYEYSYNNSSGVEYASLFSKPNLFYPVNLDKLSLSLKYNHKALYIDITGATQANPIVITSPNHGLKDGTKIHIINVGGMNGLNGKSYYIKKVNDNTFELHSGSALTVATQVDGSGFSSYTSGGSYSSHSDSDLIDLQNINSVNFGSTTDSGLKFSFEFELTLLNR